MCYIKLEKTIKYLKSSRPTAVNLAYVLIEEGELNEAEKLVMNSPSFQNPYWLNSFFTGWILLEKGEIDSAFALLYNTYKITQQYGYFGFADIHLARIMIIKEN